MHDCLLSSKSNEWETPIDLFEALNSEFGFTIDAAATSENAKLPRYFTQSDDGLSKSWKGERVWCNPPYGREIGRWIEKAATCDADLVVLLIPARTDTKAWHEFILNKAEVRFIRGRLKFTKSGGGKESSSVSVRTGRVSIYATFPSAIVIFK